MGGRKREWGCLTTSNCLDEYDRVVSTGYFRIRRLGDSSSRASSRGRHAGGGGAVARSAGTHVAVAGVSSGVDFGGRARRRDS